MGAILPVGFRLSGKLKVDLMYERSGLQRMVRALTPHVTSGHAAQFVVNQVEELGAGMLIALSPLGE